VAVSKQEIENAVFSRDEIHSLPAEMHTQVTKDGEQATLNVLTSLDLKLVQSARPMQESERCDNHSSAVRCKWKLYRRQAEAAEASAARRNHARVGAKASHRHHHGFDVKPGAYLVRLVVRDEESREITAENAAAQIP